MILLQGSPPLQYTSHDALDDFMDVLADVVETDNLNKLKAAKYYVLLFDESTDLSVRQNRIVYISTVIGTKVETHLLKLSNLEGCNDGIYKRLVEILEEKRLDRECLISLRTEGASTMVGKRSGGTTRFNKRTEVLYHPPP